MAALAWLQRRVAGDLMLAPLAVRAELRAAHAADVAQSLMLDADVPDQAVVAGELGAALLTQMDRRALVLLSGNNNNNNHLTAVCPGQPG